MKNEALKFSFVKYFVLLTVFLLSFNLNSFVSAEESSGNNFSINIVKYKLSDAQLSNSTLPQNPTGSALENNKAKDSSGNVLEVMSGVSYQIDKVVPSNNSTTPFELAPDNRSQVITTDASGKASIQLPMGIYRVTELTGSGIEKVAEPVILQLPLTLQNGEVLNDVYLYPKSSVTSGNPTPNPPDSPNEPTKIPDTAENIDSSFAVYGILGAIVLLGLYGLFIKPTKIS